jgi:hypothetical protein
MDRALRTSILLGLAGILAACGDGIPPEGSVGFINHSQHSDADLWVVWQAAQQNLAKQINLNPLQQSSSGAVPSILPGNPLALQVQPRRIEVDPQPDVSSDALSAATGMRRPDPTGLIACPQPCAVDFAPAYSAYEKPVTKYAASWESQEASFSAILQYEFENHILNALGYNTHWR